MDGKPETTIRPLAWHAHSGAVALGIMMLMPAVIGHSMSVEHDTTAVLGCIAMAISAISLGGSVLGIIRFLKDFP